MEHSKKKIKKQLSMEDKISKINKVFPEVIKSNPVNKKK
jgi:hypothetical protein